MWLRRPTNRCKRVYDAVYAEACCNGLWAVFSMALSRTCKYCSKSVRGRRDKIYCSDKCRFADWREGHREVAKPCRYCGLASSTIDHVPPQSVRPRLQELGLSGRYEFIEVWCCSECNSLLGARALWTISDRKKFIKQALRRRYKKYLLSPDWSDREVSLLDGWLQRFVINRSIEKERIQARLLW